MDRSRDSRAQIAKAALSALVFIIVLFFASPGASYVRGFAISMFTRSSAGSPYAGMSQGALIAKLTEDEQALANVKYQSVLYGALLEENQKLRKAANAAAIPGEVTARVISRPPKTLYDTLLLDQGTASGVAVGDIVAYQGIALGRIESASAGTALALLFSSSGSSEDALIGTPSAIAVARGMGGGAFELSIPQGVSIAPGDAIKISGTRSLILAIVSGSTAKPTDASQTVYAHSPVPFSELDFVEVIPAPR